MSRPIFTETAMKVVRERHPDCACAFAAGSVARGEGTPSSDIDLVVVFEKVVHAYRESLVIDGWPVEIFVHDPETLYYFFKEVDARSGCPALPSMVLDGVLLPCDAPLGLALKQLARDFIAEGPPAYTEEERRHTRYAITDLIDDLRTPRDRDEIIGTCAALYETLANFFLRCRDQWTGQRKTILKALGRTEPQLVPRYREAFRLATETGDCTALLALTEEMISPYGGYCFDGYRRDAPVEWRLTPPK